MKTRFTLLFVLIFNLSSFGQEPDFKFHLAFEDATGAKDTVWAVWDSTAQSFPGNYDTIFGEFPQSLPNDTNFRVYIRYNVTDSGKVRAEPISGEGNTFLIRAVNYVYPITMRWDSSLFTQNTLPFIINTATLGNEWFFFNWNDPNFMNRFNMLLTDSVELPTFTWGSQDHFPINFEMGHDPFISVKENRHLATFQLYPNPTNSKVHILIEDETKNYQLSLLDMVGKNLKQGTINKKMTTLNLEELPKGVYFLKITDETNVFIKKIIKQ